MKRVKTIGLVAHDNRKQDLVEWVEWNWKELIIHRLVCTGTTGRLVEEALNRMCTQCGEKIEPIEVTRLKSGPLGGDQELGALIAEGKVDMLFFLWDPMQPQPHDVDVKALLRITVLYNIPTANNRSTADFMISSDLMKKEYHPILKDYSSYIDRQV
jgi:methylglyoxal synthase